MAQKRYTVEFEHFENAILTEARIAWETLMAGRYRMAQDRREKVARMFKRVVEELKPEMEAWKKARMEMQDARDKYQPNAVQAEDNGKRNPIQ